jgi:NAD(P)-dependent dehydrogenase (short-subunit alcohol dehydrogenase family)
MRLNDNLAIVTRAGSGIGKEIAIIFGRQGAKGTVADLNQKATGDRFERQTCHWRGHGCRRRTASGCAAQAIMTFGTLNILVSNAGIVRRE